MEKTAENIDKAITNLISPEDDVDLDFVPVIRDAYLKGEPIEEVVHPTKGSIADAFHESIPSYLQLTLPTIFDRYQPTDKEKFEANAETIIVKVGDREFETFLDESGVQRFRGNTVTRYIVDNGGYLLNELVMAYYDGKFTDDDFLTFYTSFGYSVGGFCDVSNFSHLDVENPLWD